MKKVISVICVLAILCTMAFGFTGCGKVEVKATIGVLTLGNIFSYNEILSGFEDSLNSRYEEGEVVYIEKAVETEDQLAAAIQALVDEKVDAIVTLGDEASVAAVEKGLSIPVFFLGVSDAVGLGLTTNLTAPDKNATGAEGTAPVGKLLEEIAKLTEVKSFGILYDETSGESNTTVETLIAKLEEAGIPYGVKTITSKEEAKAATESLVASHDALFLPKDKTVQAAYGDIMSATGNTPVFGCEESAAQFGAVLAVGIDVRGLGGAVGQSVYQVLNGKAISEIPVVLGISQQTYINHGKAIELGYTLNDEFMNTAYLVNRQYEE